MTAERVTLKQVAEKLGVHPTTVSMALRNHPRIPVTTRDRIKRKAEEMGYAPDPVLASLNAYRHRTRGHKTVGTLAWINIYDDTWKHFTFLKDYHNGAEREARKHGYHLENFNGHPSQVQPRRLQKILETRGIAGLIIPPVQNPEVHGSLVGQLDWTRFAGITVGYTVTQPQIHRVASDHYHALLTILKTARNFGYKRPGLILQADRTFRTDHLWEAGFMIGMQQLFGRFDESLLEVYPSDRTMEETFPRWFRQARPDLVISQASKSPYPLLDQLGLSCPDDFGVVHLEDSHEAVASYNQNNELIGRTVVNQVISSLHRNEYGVPEIPLTTLVKGRLVIRGTMTDSTQV